MTHRQYKSFDKSCWRDVPGPGRAWGGSFLPAEGVSHQEVARASHQGLLVQVDLLMDSLTWTPPQVHSHQGLRVLEIDKITEVSV